MADHFTVSNRLFISSVSAAALAAAIVQPAAAQTAAAPAASAADQAPDRVPAAPAVRPPESAPDTSATDQEIVVTGRRAAIESAIKRKENASSIIDSVLADDAGKLPDNSITEVLQRVSGVSIVRFDSLGDPDHFSAEGSGIQVRGLSGVAGRLNGREIFSANGGRQLSFQDVTPELMSAVDVYKSPTADLIEGGTGGQIDLRTKMPFDYKKFTVQGNFQGQYGDLTKKTTYGESGLVTDTFETPIGKIGFLVDVAHNKYVQRSDFVRAEPYYKTAIGGTDYYIPGGFDYGNDDYSRTRKGYYAAVQWEPAPEFQTYATFFRSEYDDDHRGSGEFVVTQTPAVDVATSTFDKNNGLLSTDSLYVRNPTTFGPQEGVTAFGGDSGAAKGTSITSDYSTGFKWDLSSRLHLSSAFQYVDSTSSSATYDVFPGVNLANQFGFDATGSLPKITLPSSDDALITDPTQYIWEATMDHNSNNHGKLYAGNLDLNVDLSDEGFFRSFQFGGRYADRTERDLNSGYNWVALGRGWNGDPQLTFADARDGDVSTAAFKNFFRGKIDLPTGLLAPSFDMVDKYDVVGDHAYYGGNPVKPIGYIPINLTTSETKTYNAYGMIRFQQDQSIFGWQLTGNVGARLVHTENRSQGFIQQNTATFIRDGAEVTFPAVGYARSGGRTYTRVLPAVNVQLLPMKDIHLRFAYDITLDNPSFGALAAGGTVGVTTTNNPNGPAGGPGQFSGFNGNAGNPNLKPEISNNLDLSLEWYPNAATQFHVALFHKAIENVAIYAVNLQPIDLVENDGQTVTEQVSETGVTTSTKNARVQGLEAGARTYFDMLPGLLSGIGVEANFTYIDSKNPGDRYLDISGIEHTDVPLSGLSKYNLNATLLYDKGPVSARLAYSWRNRYLMTTSSNGTNGTYQYFPVATADTSTIPLTQISLPIYSEPYGSLDAGITLTVIKGISLSLEAQNITNETAKTSMGGYPGGARYIRSWFTTDRRYNASVNFTF